MGKIRIKAVGDEEAEKDQLEKSKARSEAKKVEKATAAPEEVVQEVTTAAEEVAEEPVKKAKKEKFQKAGKTRSESYKTNAALIDSSKKYTLAEAVKLIPELKKAKFDETVEIHLTASETGISGSVTLPHGTGKTTRVVVADGANQEELEKLIKDIESGTINFDILVATPDAMPKLAKVARTLGPRGLMPNPKNGTVTTKPEEVAKNYEGGQINFKTEAKFPLIHVAVGKVSFSEDKIKENVKVVMKAIDKTKIKNATIKSTMSPAIHLDLASL